MTWHCAMRIGCMIDNADKIFCFTAQPPHHGLPQRVSCYRPTFALFPIGYRDRTFLTVRPSPKSAKVGRYRSNRPARHTLGELVLI